MLKKIFEHDSLTSRYTITLDELMLTLITQSINLFIIVYLIYNKLYKVYLLQKNARLSNIFMSFFSLNFL